MWSKNLQKIHNNKIFIKLQLVRSVLGNHWSTSLWGFSFCFSFVCFFPVLSCGVVYYAEQGVFNF